MNTYTAHVWKELRAERRTLAILALLLPATVGLLTAFLPRHTLGDGIAVDLVVAICLVTTLTAIGADLLPRERRGTAALLARVPGALRASFLAKLTLYLGLLGASVLYGLGIAVVCSLTRRGALPGGIDSLLEPWKLGTVLLLALSVFGVSAWLPRGALSLPATGFYLALMSLPFWGAFQGHPMFHLEPVQLALGGAAIGLGALASAWTTFVWGGRGRAKGTSVAAGLAVAALGFAPGWTWSAWRWSAAYSRVPVVADVIVGESGRYAFVSTSRRELWRSPFSHADGDPYSAVVVDTYTGDWEIAGTAGSSLWTSRRAHRRPLTTRHFARVGLLEFDDDAGPARVTTWFGGLRGAPETPGNDEATTAEAELLAQLGLDFDDLRERRVNVYGCGTGVAATIRAPELRRRLGETSVFLDPSSGRRVGLAKLEATLGTAGNQVRVLPGDWLLARDGTWLRLDPESLETSPAEGLLEGDRLGPYLADGSVLVRRSRRPLRYWPETGELVELELRDFSDESTALWRHLQAAEDRSHHYLAADRCSVLKGTSDDGEHLAILDPSENTLRFATTLDIDWEEERRLFGAGQPRYRLLSADERRALFTVDGRTLERYDLATGEVTTLFDPAWLD